MLKLKSMFGICVLLAISACEGRNSDYSGSNHVNPYMETDPARIKKSEEERMANRKWFAVDSSYRECFEESGGPSKLMEEMIGPNMPHAQDFRDSSGEIIKVEISHSNLDGTERVWYFYRDKRNCEYEQVTKRRGEADKYR